MKPWVRWAVLGTTALGIVILFVVLNPGENGGDRSPTRSPSLSPSGEPTPSASPTPSETEPPEPQVREIEVTVSGEDVQGPRRPTVTQGETVLLVVRADVDDHVHVHVYDLMADVSPGQPARIRFRADVPGIFEVELEDAGMLLLELEVTP